MADAEVRIVNFQQRLHQAIGLVFVLLMLSGGLLHSESLRGAIAAIRWQLSYLHEGAGVAFSLLLLANAPYIWLYRRGKAAGLNRRGYLALLLAISVLLLLSGGGLLFSRIFGGIGVAGNLFYEAHLWLAAVAVLAVPPHMIHGLIGRWRQPNGTAGRSLPPGEIITAPKQSRRGFLQVLAGAAALGGIAVAWRWIGQLAARTKTETLAIFAQCNKMQPKPVPLPESSPPIGGGYTGKFKVYKIEREIPCADAASWQFRIGGLVERPLTLRWEEFLKLPRKVQVSDFHCVEGWSVYQITYEGVRLSDLLARAGVKPEARYVKFFSAETVYTDTLSLEQAQMEDVMAAVLIDGGEIPSDLGGPVRLVVPQMFAYKAVKWLVGIELIASPHRGYWEERGYPVDAWIKPQTKKGGI